MSQERTLIANKTEELYIYYMDVKEFLKLKRKKPEGNEKKSERENNKKSSKDVLEKLTRQFKPEYSIQGDQSPESLLKSIPHKLQHLTQKKQHIQKIAASEILNFKQKSKYMYKPPLRSTRVSLQLGPVEFTFRSVNNGILPESNREVQPVFKSKKEPPLVLSFEEPEENLESFLHLFKGKEEFLSAYTRRFSLNMFAPRVLKKRQTVTFKRDSPDISSGEVSEEEVFCKAYERLFDRDASAPVPLELPSLAPINIRDYQDPLIETAIKVGPLIKRIRETSTFHERWGVLRGFKFHWYRNSNSVYSKGILSLTSEYVSDEKVGKEDCFLVPSKTRKFVFKKQFGGSAWRIALNNQIALKNYLESDLQVDQDLLNFFQDTNITHFVLKNYQLQDPLLTCLSHSLPAHLKLQILELENCCLEDEHLRTICQCLMGSSQVTSVNFNSNLLTSQAAKSLALLIKQEQATWNNLINISLSDNEFKDEGLEILCRALSVRFEQLFWPKALHQLPINKLELANTGISDAGLYAICALFNKTMMLIKDEEEIEPRIDLNVSQNAFSSRGFSRLMVYVRNFQGLSSLNFSGTHIDREAVMEFAEALRTNYSLTSVNLRDIEIDEVSFRALVSALKENYVLSKVDISLKNVTQEFIKLGGKLQSLFAFYND